MGFTVGTVLMTAQTYLRKYDKIVKFLIGGIFVTILQVTLLYFFTQIFKIWYLLSSQLSFVIAFIVSFLVYREWVFLGGSKTSQQQFILYAILTVVTFFANGLGMFILVDWLGIWYLLSQIIVKAILSVANYFFYNVFIFNK